MANDVPSEIVSEFRKKSTILRPKSKMNVHDRTVGINRLYR